MPVPYIVGNPFYDANWAWTGNGTVTSIGLTSTDLAISNSPITTSGNITANLTTTGVVAGTYGSKNQIPQFTVDTKGRITAASNITPATSMLFAQTQTVTVANTAVETDLTGTGVGTLTIAANSMQVGSTFSGIAMGIHSASGNPTIQIRVYSNATLILDTGAVTSGNSTNATWEFRGVVTVRSIGSTGTVVANGFYMETGGGANVFGMASSTAPITIDTTISQTLRVTVTWGTASASNSLSVSNLNVQGWGPPQ